MADDSSSGEMRTFRIDRLEEWAHRRKSTSPRLSLLRRATVVADGDVPSAVLRLAPAARWVAERTRYAMNARMCDAWSFAWPSQ